MRVSTGKKIFTISLQCLFALLIAAAIWWLFHNTLENMRTRGIRAGFDFLAEPAGFDIGESLIDFNSSMTYWRAFLAGLANTVHVALLGVVVTTLLGTAIGIARLSSNFLLRALATSYVESLRNVPLLVQLLMWYFAFTTLLPNANEAAQIGSFYLSKSGLSYPAPTSWISLWSWVAFVASIVGALLYRASVRALSPMGIFLVTAVLSSLTLLLAGHAELSFEVPEKNAFNVSGGGAFTPEFLSVLLGLSTYTAAFFAEVVRGGIQSVSLGQVEAARALGMTKTQQLHIVVLPLALRAIVPSATNQYLNLTKNSSLAVAIGYPDLVSVGNTALNQTGRAFECIALIMATYFVLSLLIASLMNVFNARVALRGA